METGDRVTLWFIKQGNEPVLARTRLEARGPDSVIRKVECARVTVRRQGASGFPWGEGKNTVVLALALVRAARWAFQSPPPGEEGALPVLRGPRPGAASRLADLVYAPDHVYWLGDMLAPDDGPDRPRPAPARLQRWFHFTAGYGPGGREVVARCRRPPSRGSLSAGGCPRSGRASTGGMRSSRTWTAATPTARRGGFASAASLARERPRWP